MRINPGRLILPGPAEIQIIHKETIRTHGGFDISSDRRKISAAINEVVMFHAYTPEADIALLAAVVAYAFAKGHPLPDGNKRVGFASIRMVLRVNGFSWKPRHDEAIQRMWKLAESDTRNRMQVLEGLAAWIRQDCAPLVD